jgi:hypothetical protein
VARPRIALAEQLCAADNRLEFLTGQLQGSHAPVGVVFNVLVIATGKKKGQRLSPRP